MFRFGATGCRANESSLSRNLAVFSPAGTSLMQNQKNFFQECNSEKCGGYVGDGSPHSRPSVHRRMFDVLSMDPEGGPAMM